MKPRLSKNASPALVLLIISCVTLLQSCTPKETPKSSGPWWKEAIIYQIYPRSFKDTDGDGVGDLKGIIEKLDYIKSLGVTAVWINPIYQSPNDDNGYDISDYRQIMKEFGTMEDFDALLKGLHERNIKFIMDVVVNHSSDEHEWFKASRSSRSSPYRNYYHWWNADRGKPSPRYSLFDVNHDAWMYDSATDAYYLHYFSRKQPDLNWENPTLRKEIYDMMRYWADKGVDGFRLDAFGFASKDTAFPVYPEGYEKNFMKYYSMGPHLHEYLQEMDREVFSQYDVLSVAEGAGNSFEDAHRLVDEDRNELNMAYAFEGVDIAKKGGYSLQHFKNVYSKWDSAFAEKGWLAIFLANHDQARMVSRFGSDKPEFREASSKMLSTFIMTMRGTPYYYNGDELGMTNAYFKSIEEYRDMPTLNEYENLKQHGGDLNAFLERIQFECRDNGRTPFQWANVPQAGFTTGKPWLQVNENYTEINAAEQESNAQSCLNYFRKLTAVRKANPTLVYGKYEIIDRAHPQLYAYKRTDENGSFLVLLNFSEQQVEWSAEDNLTDVGLVLDNYEDEPTRDGAMIVLRPYEAVVLQLK